MTAAASRAPLDWSCDQIEQFRAIHSRYVQYAKTLREVLAQAVGELAPLAIVQTRAKTAPSFAEKIQRKWPEHKDPVHQFTDLCGGRVITFTRQEVQAVCDFITGHFEIDWENSVDVSQRLEPTEFGYRSVHYVVQFRPGIFPSPDVNVTIPEEIFGLKAEIQVRTLLEHAWAGFNHDRVYKGAFAVPDKWKRELAGVAAMLEEADQAFSRIDQGLQRYAANYGDYMTRSQMRAEMALLENVLACDPDNAVMAHRIGKLAMILGDWGKAVKVLEPHASSDYRPLLRDLGVSLCKLHKADPSRTEYRAGQTYLQRAIDPQHPDPDALASLAGTWKALDPLRARDLYRQAYEVAPSDPYAVGNFLASEIAFHRDLSPVPLMAPAIAAAMQRCRDHIEVAMNVPWAYHDLGTFHLVLNQPFESLAATAKAIQLSPSKWFVERALQSLTRLEVVRNELTGYDWVYRMMLLALAAKYRQQAHVRAVAELASPGARPLAGPVVLVAGSCHASYEEQMQGYRSLLVEGLRDFRGTLISGGTTCGVGRLVGDIQQAHPHAIYTVGHIPRSIPADCSVDRRYSELRQCESHDFDPLGPLQAWADIITSGIGATRVKLVGLGGGRIAAVEYRLALALGAEVAIIEGSGRSAAQLLGDDAWNKSKNLVRLPADPGALRGFLDAGES